MTRPAGRGGIGGLARGGKGNGRDEDPAAARHRGGARLPVAGQAGAGVVAGEPGGHRPLRRRDRGPGGGVAQLGQEQGQPRAQRQRRDARRAASRPVRLGRRPRRGRGARPRRAPSAAGRVRTARQHAAGQGGAQREQDSDLVGVAQRAQHRGEGAGRQHGADRRDEKLGDPVGPPGQERRDARPPGRRRPAAGR